MSATPEADPVVVQKVEELATLVATPVSQTVVMLELSGCGACIQTLAEIEKLKRSHPEIRFVIVNQRHMSSLRDILVARKILPTLSHALATTTRFPRIIAMNATGINPTDFDLNVRVKTGLMDRLGIIHFLGAKEKLADQRQLVRAVKRKLEDVAFDSLRDNLRINRNPGNEIWFGNGSPGYYKP